jgi:hypothetical protein
MQMADTIDDVVCASFKSRARERCTFSPLDLHFQAFVIVYVCNRLRSCLLLAGASI